MKKPNKNRWAALMILAAVTAWLPTTIAAADTKATLTCVGLMSETGDGNISWRLGRGEWKIVKLGDVIPVAAEVRINVDRDWIELIPTAQPTTVYDLEGRESGDVLLTGAQILKGKARTVAFPKKSSQTDPKFKDKLVVCQVMGRQVYRASADADDQDLRYGDVLDLDGKVSIIGINNTLNLMFPNGAVTTIVGPLKFDVKKVFAGTNLYKYLNVR